MQKQTQQLAHVYAIQNELGLVKIGFAHNPDKRFKSIEASSGLRITESYVSPVCFNFAEIEKSLHNQFASFRKAGEWFDIDFITVKNAIDTHFLTVDAHELTTPALKSLIPISQSQIGTDTVQAVDARTLHQWLESKQEFANWIKSRIDKYGFVEGQDFTVDKFINGKATQVDYLISLDMAKELSMVERTTKGKEARQYFIACEKALRNPGHSLDENTKAFLYAAVRQIAQEVLQPVVNPVKPQNQPIIEKDKILAQVHRFFEQFGFSRFKDIKTVGKPNEEWIPRLAGFRKTIYIGNSEKTSFYVFPQVFTEEICDGLSPKLVIKTCIKNGLIEPPNDGRTTKTKRLPNIGPKRVYHFTAKVFGE